MTADATPDDRCGFSYDTSTLPGVGVCSCWRPTLADAERCVWHVADRSLSREVYERFAPAGPERLDGAVLETVSLDDVDWFEDCSLVGAEFSSVDLRRASLVRTDLREATLEDVDAREADLTEANVEDASIRVCDLRFAVLRDARFDQTVVSNVRVNRETEFGDSVVYETALADEDDPARVRRLAQAAIWAYREIQDLYEANALPFEARHFYLKEKDVRRKLAWTNGNVARAIASVEALLRQLLVVLLVFVLTRRIS